MRAELVREQIVLGLQNKRELITILVIQALVALMLIIVVRYGFDHHAACSAVYGTGISILPTWVFALILFRYQGASMAKHTVHNMYVAEGVKMATGALLFGAVIGWGQPNWSVVFVSYLLTQLSLCIAPLFSK
ncbi:MAG: ATP synthase subunit I [Gammaproteobacteria bacterium]|nr:ATP synthase subunit I [Gammaproteobacteria bacterium]